jgi:hypothetical protein
MQLITFSTGDIIGTIGVAILLTAFLLNLLGRMPKAGLAYIILNFTGASLACLASVLIQYLPFVILEGVWALVSLIALISRLKK